MSNASIRYGAKIRKQYAAVKKEKIAKYKCPECGSLAVRRVSNAIWQCRHCNATFAGGSYTFTTTAGEIAGRIMKDLSKSRKPKVSMADVAKAGENEGKGNQQ